MIRVLHAEDDPQVATLLRLAFARQAPDCAVETVDSGHACLDRMRAGGIDVLLVDLNLPDLDGLHVLAELAARRDPTPVIMVSGLGQTELAVRALRAGAVDCVDKNSPDFRQLPARMKGVLERHRQTLRAVPTTIDAVRHRVLWLDPVADPAETARLLAAHAPSLDFAIFTDPAAVPATLAGPPPASAVVLGPGLPTPEALAQLRRLQALPEAIPVLLLAARNDGDTAVAALKLGAHDYLVQQPGPPTELLFSLQAALRHLEQSRLARRLGRELAELNRSLESQVVARTAELHALSARLLQVQEDERRALALELHDQIGQQLTGLKFMLGDAARGAAGTALAPKVAAITAVADELLHSVRELTRQLRPRLLDDLGLRAALEWHVRQFGEQTSLPVELEITLPAARLPAALETTVFRLVQEALTNIARHAGSPTAEVTVTTGAEGLIVEIADRGRGFDVSRARATSASVGLSGMRERVHLAGGTLEIDSRPGFGTLVHARFPLPLAA